MSEALKQQIIDAFADVPYPGNWCLRGSDEGSEPFLLENEFKDKTDWRTLDAKFIDLAPDGFASALSFFSDEAFRFYLPAYLLADIDGLLEHCDPVVQLCYAFGDANTSRPLNPLRYGNRTWSDYAEFRFSVFSPEQAAAIAEYLRYQRDSGAYIDTSLINQALRNYWEARGQPPGRPV